MSNHTNRSDTTSEGPPEKKSSGAVPTSSPVPAATEAVTIQRHSSRFQEADSAGEDRQPSPFVPDDAGGYETTTKVLLKYPEGCKTKSQEFIWPHGGEEVKLTGDFVRWGQGLLMDPQDTRTDEGANSGQRKEFRLTIPVPVNCCIAYKFIVDGQWKYDPGQPWVTDGSPPSSPRRNQPSTNDSEESLGLPIMDDGSSNSHGTDTKYTEKELTDLENHGGNFDAEYGYSPTDADTDSYLYISPSATVGDLKSLRGQAPTSKSFQGWIQARQPYRRRFEDDQGNYEGAFADSELARPYNTGENVCKTSEGSQSYAHSGEQATMRSEGKLVVATVGLPARGKTYIAKKLQRHLMWLGMKVELYNVGNYRREVVGNSKSHDFFDPGNEEAVRMRWKLANEALSDMLERLKSANDPIDIGIFDATNSTKERREWLQKQLHDASTERAPIHLVFVESICDDDNIIRANVRETKLKSPDYENVPEDEAVEDFLKRISHYLKVYQRLEDSENVPYVQLHDVGRKVILNRMNGFLHSRVAYFLMNVNITPRPIWLTRHGESEYNIHNRIGGDSNLSPKGMQYGEVLARFISEHYPQNKRLIVWTSNLARAKQTVRYLKRPSIAWRNLDELDAGVCDGMTYEEVATKMPEEYGARKRDKFHYRYPRGESYQDIVHRLEPVIIELMRQSDPVLIISHQATLRVLYAYLTDKEPSKCPDLPIPLHSLIQITPKAYGHEEVRHDLM